jgi:hypothetical protein
MWPPEAVTGNGYLLEYVLQPLLLHTETAASYDKVMNRFSTMLETSLVVLLDDCKTTSDTTQTKLKSILSEERQHVERKQLQGKMVHRYTRFILASNAPRPLYLDPDERRWLVFNKIVHRVDGDETQAFIAVLDKWIKSDGALDALYNWFMSFDLTGFNHKRAPQSAALKAIVALTSHDSSTIEIRSEQHKEANWCSRQDAQVNGRGESLLSAVPPWLGSMRSSVSTRIH